MNEHAAVVEALLDGDPNLTVYDGPRRDGDPVREPPYVVYYVHIPDERRTKLHGDTDETWFTITTHSVGANMEAARIIQSNVRSSLLDVRPIVAGWVCDRISHEVGRSPDWDTSTGTLVASAVDQWDYRAEPA